MAQTPFLVRLMGGNNHTKCCGVEPTLRVAREKLVDFQCAICNRKGGEAVDAHDAGINWEQSILRVEKHKKELAKKENSATLTFN